MADELIKESALDLVTTISDGDFVRVVTSAGASRRIDFSKFNKILVLGFAIGDETTDMEVATGVLTFQMPNFATTLESVSVNVGTAPTGSIATFDLNEAGVSVLSTKITIDATEKTSETAAIPPVISDSSIAANAVMTVDIDGIGSTIAGAGGKFWMYIKRV